MVAQTVDPRGELDNLISSAAEIIEIVVLTRQKAEVIVPVNVGKESLQPAQRSSRLSRNEVTMVPRDGASGLFDPGSR